MSGQDRGRTFDPVTVPKHKCRLDGVTGTAISLYEKGVTTSDLQADPLETYGLKVRWDTISRIADVHGPECQNRPLGAVDPVLL